MTCSYIVPGGVTFDAPDGWFDRVEGFVDQFLENVVPELHGVLTSNGLFIKRTADVGTMSAETAIAYGCTGPVLRGSGVDWDLRRDGEPLYTKMYEPFEFDVMAPDANGQYRGGEAYPGIPKDAVVGDSWHRFFIRMVECVQSVRLIKQAIRAYNEAGRRCRQTDQNDRKVASRRSLYRNGSPQRPDGLYGHR